MSSKLNFDASKVAPAQPMEPIPSDWYPCIIIESEVKPTQKKGTRLALTFQVVDGEFKGRKIFDGINLTNENPIATQIGQEQLSAICHGTGAILIKDTKELHNKPLNVKVALEDERWVDKANKSVAAGTVGATKYDARNVTKGFKPLEGAVAPAGTVASAATGGAAKPWEKKKVEATPAAEPTVAEANAPTGQAFDGARLFWAALEEGADAEERSGDQLMEMLADGMPADMMVQPQDGEGAGEWGSLESFGIVLAAPAGEPEPTKKAPAGPAKKAAPAAPAKTAVPAKDEVAPWKRGKK